MINRHNLDLPTNPFILFHNFDRQNFDLPTHIIINELKGGKDPSFFDEIISSMYTPLPVNFLHTLHWLRKLVLWNSVFCFISKWGRIPLSLFFFYLFLFHVFLTYFIFFIMLFTGIYFIFIYYFYYYSFFFVRGCPQIPAKWTKKVYIIARNEIFEKIFAHSFTALCGMGGGSTKA